jgi:hypothetical protein
MTEAQHAIATQNPLCELLQWIDASKRLPDSDITVLCWSTEDGEFFCGYWDADSKSWIACAAALSGTGMKPTLQDYVPLYRTPAGTGSSCGFMTWTN